MKFEYGRLSEKRNEEIENMQIINPFGELWVPRLSFKGIRVVKSEDEYYVFKHLIGGPNFYDAHPDEAYYLFVCKDKYYFITLGDGDYTREIVNEWKPHIENMYHMLGFGDVTVEPSQEMIDEYNAIQANKEKGA